METKSRWPLGPGPELLLPPWGPELSLVQLQSASDDNCVFHDLRDGGMIPSIITEQL